MRAKNLVFHGFLVTIAAAWVGFTASRAAATMDEVALGLKDSIALIGSDDRTAAAGLRDLAASEKARPLRDVVLYFLARAERQSAPSDAVARLEELLASFPQSPLAARAAAELVELDATREKPEAITPLLDRFAGDDAPRADAARLALIAGERLTPNDVTAATRALERARRLGRGDRVSRDAAERLRSCAQSTELAPKDAQDIYEEAKLAAAEGDTTAQIEWLDRLIAKFPASPRFTDAILQRARAIARSEGRSAAAAWLESRAKSGTASFKASSLHAAANHRWNADEDDRALADFERVIALKVGGRLTQESHYSIGRIHESHQRYTSAAAAYRRARDGVDEALAAESDWRSGWASYLAGNYDGAAKSFGEMAERYRTRLPKSGRESALYWHARSTERTGKSAAAAAIYQKLLAEFPDGYYAYVTERRTKLIAPAPKPAPLAPVLAATEDTEIRERTMRIAILSAVGLHDIAAIEIDRLVESADLDRKRSLLPELARLGAHGPALRTALGLYHRNRLSESELYAFLYPPAYSLLVARESAVSGIDPYLVYSLMKQESLFDPRAVSPAFAYGLMQLLPTTARRVAGDADIGGEDLFDPALNIRLGTAYLAELSRRFGGESVFMLAGYNAGETAADSWQARYGKLEIDEMIERITYRETRDYVKKVLANYRNYLRLYGDAGTVGGTEQSQQTPR
jgi:soluble lytic murein transglycosylase-like protein